ncbi:MAG: hypothetical protein AYK22_03705 [Thermoplasmatales archaeon SG8-52-3]|nr:MAG: hypothetical protein AYK22_03705 [Thermoplasmatales archaeon SG8-52-3]
MNKNKDFYKNKEASKATFKRSQFVIFMSICLIAIVAFTMISIASTSSDPMERVLYKIPESPFAPANSTEIQYCDTCHTNEMPDTWMTVEIDSQTTDQITYSVTGSDTYDGEEGWGVFDPLENNIANGLNSGLFTLNKDGKAYRAFWVDNGTGGTGEGGGGSAFYDIITPNDPPTDPTIDGPTSGSVGETLTYTISSTEPQGHDIFYKVDWGDGTEDDWIGPYSSGEEVTVSHSYSQTGTFTIKVQARDEFGALSDWSDFIVEITTEPKLKIKLKAFSIGKVCAVIKNAGTGNVSDINWNITVKGGTFRLIKRINANATGVIGNLGQKDKEVVCTLPKSITLRFGLARVTVTATIGENEFTNKQFVFVFGRFIFARPKILGI